MPVEFDTRPGSGNKKQRRRDGTLPGRIKPPAPEAPRTMLRIRMLQSFTCRLGTYRQGQVVEVPVDTARSWIGFGLAEQDKMLSGAPETKGG